jgi:acetyl-CoA acetyltransferase family protein
MPEAVIVAAARTAVGTAGKGTLTETEPAELAKPVVAELMARAKLSPEEVDDLILAESMYGGGVIGRYVAVDSGMTDVPGQAVNRHCASSLASISNAAAAVRSGNDDIIIAGGVNSSSLSPMSVHRTPGTQDWEQGWISPSHPDREDAPNRDMSITVGWNTAKICGFTREEIDAWALRSHERAIAAIDAGHFKEEIVPITVTNKDGETVVFDTDEHPRRGSTMEKMASLKVLHPEIEGFSITAGSASGVNDAAAAVVVMSDEAARSKGLAPLAKVLSWAAVGVDPYETGMAPTKAIPKALAKAGLSIDDVDLMEVNEAFAPVPMAVEQKLGFSGDKINVSGSGCSLGHPIGATGARMVTTLIYDLRRRGGGIGVAAMCAGGGMAQAVVLEVPAP